MSSNASLELMMDIENRYQEATGLRSRDHYSIFYGPLRPSKFLMINANPGGSPDSYTIVDVAAGQHEYIEGRNSGPTTRNAAEMLHYIVGSDDPDSIRGVQILNRYFRRSPGVDHKVQAQHMSEARPFLRELINYIKPEAMLFGGDSGVELFAKAHGGKAKGSTPLKGPNGSHEAVYFREYELSLPYYKTIPAFGIYHPSKMNGFFRREVFPLLRDKLGHLLAA